MTDSPLITPDGETPQPARRTPWLPIGMVVVVLAAVAAFVAWQQLSARQSIPDWERLPELVLAAPAGDAFASDTPWAQVRLAPLRPDAENTIQAATGFREGPSMPAGAPPHLTQVAVVPMLGEQPRSAVAVVEAGENGALSGPIQLGEAGWYLISAEVTDSKIPPEFYLLVPDPNINGPNSVPRSPSSAEGEAVFQRGLAATHALQSVRYTEWIADGGGNSAVSEHAVVAGGDGEPAAFSFRITGGMEAVVIGTTRWVRPPGVGWQRQEGATVVPPSEWGEEYSGATGFALLGEETIDGELTQIVAFVAPELSEPRRRTVAWYLWWVGIDTGHVRREAMVSRRHYMLHHFSAFDEPMQILPPDEGATPGAGTPTAEATPIS